MTLRRVLWGVLALAATPLVGSAQTPAPAIVPRTTGATGFSTIEQRWAYAPPDEGTLEIEMSPGVGAPNEVVIQEPVMCRANSSAHARIDYSKSRNTVDVTVDFHGLPYRMSYTRPVDISTPYNRYPVSVQDGRWQIWFVQRLFNADILFYYDPNTLQLIGNEYDTATPPANAIAVKVPTLRMVESPIFEGTPNGEAHFVYHFAYAQMIDFEGTGGVAVAYLPFNLCFPDQYGTYYTNGGLPPARALSFDAVLESIHGGYGMALATSLEPAVKPEYLKARDNPMIGWGGAYPFGTPMGVSGDPVQGTVVNASCGPTHINRGWPTPYYNICFGH